jgi:hypothetical protein
LLSPSYSANAYPFSTRYQNCNQWLAETAGRRLGRPAPADDTAAHAQAQRWLQTRGYEPHGVRRGLAVLMWVSA